MMTRIKNIAVLTAMASCMLMGALTANAATSVYPGNNEVHYQLEDGSMAPEYWVKANDGTWSYHTGYGTKISKNMVPAYDNEYYMFDLNGNMYSSTQQEWYGIMFDIEESGRAVPRPTKDGALEQYAKEVAETITKDAKTDQEKLNAVFDYAWNIKFDPSVGTNGNLPAAATYTFDTGKGNCFSQASLVHYLCQALGYKDTIVDSGYNHWWNLVKVGDKYVHIDVTPFDGYHGWNQVTTKELYESSKASNMVDYLHKYEEKNFPCAQ